MNTIREYLERLIQRNACIFSDEGKRACKTPANACDWCNSRWDAEAALAALNESETAWRNTGDTYRLVPDAIEVPS